MPGYRGLQRACFQCAPRLHRRAFPVTDAESATRTNATAGEGAPRRPAPEPPFSPIPRSASSRPLAPALGAALTRIPLRAMARIARLVASRPEGMVGGAVMALTCRQLAAAVRAALRMRPPTVARISATEVRERRQSLWRELGGAVGAGGGPGRGSVCVIAPAGGAWAAGETVEARWVHTGTVERVSVSLWRDTGGLEACPSPPAWPASAPLLTVLASGFR